VEQLTLYLREIQSDLEAKMRQSIETHILGKQKLVNTLHDALPAIHKHRAKEISTDDELNSLIEMMEVREKIDFALDAVEGVVSRAQDQPEST
jgi:predicted house-cleaning noncanonical NTP pyrophosphatase (MazG superfamily)